MLSFGGLDNKRLRPIIMKPIAAESSINISGIIFAIDPPNKTPIREAKTRAKEDPRKTAKGLLLVPLIAKVAICVLSPSSAIKIVRKIEMKIANVI